MLIVMTDNSLLGYALLGLIYQQPLSGYDVKKIFASTPMAGFSDSPGAIYPALRKLERLGFVRARWSSWRGCGGGACSRLRLRVWLL